MGIAVINIYNVYFGSQLQNVKFPPSIDCAIPVCNRLLSEWRMRHYKKFLLGNADMCKSCAKMFNSIEGPANCETCSVIKFWNARRYTVYFLCTPRHGEISNPPSPHMKSCTPLYLPIKDDILVDFTLRIKTINVTA